MGVKKYIQRYKAYESKSLADRRSSISKRLKERRDSKEELIRIRRKAYMEEAKKQAGIRGKMMAKQKYSGGSLRLQSINSALGNPYNVQIQRKPVAKKKKRKKQRKGSRTVVKYVYR